MALKTIVQASAKDENWTHVAVAVSNAQAQGEDTMTLLSYEDADLKKASLQAALIGMALSEAAGVAAATGPAAGETINARHASLLRCLLALGEVDVLDGAAKAFSIGTSLRLS